MKESGNFYVKLGIWNALFPGNLKIYEEIKVMWVSVLAVHLILKGGKTPNNYIWHILSVIQS